MLALEATSLLHNWFVNTNVIVYLKIWLTRLKKISIFCFLVDFCSLLPSPACLERQYAPSRISKMYCYMTLRIVFPSWLGVISLKVTVFLWNSYSPNHNLRQDHIPQTKNQRWRIQWDSRISGLLSTLHNSRLLVHRLTQRWLDRGKITLCTYNWGRA